MSQIKAILHRSNDCRILKTDINCDYSGVFDYALVSFKCGNNDLEVLSTSAGGIQDGNIKLYQPVRLHSFIEYCTEKDILECLIGYYVQKELVYYENLSAIFDHQKIIKNSNVSVPELRTVNSSFTNRFSDFKETLKRAKSSWNAEIKLQDDILVLFSSNGEQSALLSFGEESEDVLASDYIFNIEPPTNKLYIPRDFFNRRREQYSLGCKLGVFELIKPDFVSNSNLYYKIPICNTKPLLEF